MKEEHQIFVPGRLCLFGEHSDWAGQYRIENSNIVEGYAIVTGIEQGIYATVSLSDKLEIIDKVNNNVFEISLDKKILKEVAESDSFYSYICGVTLYMMEKYHVNGIKIVIDKATLPIKKGLSSSAACCVLTCRAFNIIYHLNLSPLEEMKCAYYGELKTLSYCGQMDQICAFGSKTMLLIFDGNDIKISKLKIGGQFYLVFADLMGKKDTKKILLDLNKAYPFPKNENDINVQKYLGSMNKENILLAIDYLKKGDSLNLGKLMIKVQEEFDKYVAPSSLELVSPILHKTLNDNYIKTLIYGGKGVGSQGDGTIQFLAKDKYSQEKLNEYLQNELHMNSYMLTIGDDKNE